MRLSIQLLFLTFVLGPVFSHSAPQPKTTLESAPLEDQDDPSLKNIDPYAKAPPTFWLGLSIGYSGGNYLERDEYEQGPFFALRYMPLAKDDLPTWDYQVEVTQDNLIGLTLGHRWYCCRLDPFNPYARLAAATFLEGSGELGGFVEIRRWRARAALGMGEKFIWEFGTGLSVTGPDIYAQFGYNFAF
ncbi:MAG: hypothetical protein AAGB31_05650 [Bdellovibrio sp.]